jgi:6-phosphogluconolactonase
VRVDDLVFHVLGADRIVTYKFDDNGLEFYKESLFKDSDGTRHIE